jgi:hypothetical protein
MKDELFKQLIALVFGGVLGVLFKYWYDYKAMVYKELWQKRYETYKTLFLLTGILPLYPAKAEVTYEELFTMSEKMRNWYFEEGGLLLSANTRNKYFEVQKEIQKVLIGKNDETILQKIIDEYDFIRDKFSELRTEMTHDLMSRVRFGKRNSEPTASKK